MRIINVVENLDKGAVENWLVNVFIESRKIRPDWQWTFYCILGREGRLDKKVREAGGQIIYAPCTISRKLKFLKAFRKTLKSGQYDIIHSHHDFLSGFYLLASMGIGFKKRILHVHNTDEALPVGNKMLHKILLRPFRLLAFHFSNVIAGVSNDTLQKFIKKNVLRRKKTTVLYCGIDMNRFGSANESEDLRKELHIPPQAKLLLFCGRMNEIKNPVFVVDILYELLQKHEEVYAVFAGKGDLEKDVVKRAEALGISQNIRMLGWRNDTAAIMKSCDVFVFPRIEYPKEALGLVIIEAQAAGLPMVISKAIVEDAIIIKELSHVVPLENSASQWVSIIAEIFRQNPLPKEEALNRMKNSKFELGNSTRNVIALYEL